jgi:hypothetical protein
MYTEIRTPVAHKGMLGIELIDARGRDLAWRLFVSEKILQNDPDNWATISEEPCFGDSTSRRCGAKRKSKMR